MAGDKGMVALTRTINQIGTAFEEFRNVNDERIAELKAKIDAVARDGGDPDQIAALRDRIEELESRRDGPRAVRRSEPKDYTVHHLGDEKIYELSASAKMADVLRPAKEPEVSLERWLAAALLGEKCQDKEAVQYARGIHASTGTGTTGVLVPEEFISAWIDRLRDRMVLQAACMTTVTMQQGTQTHSRVLTDPTVAWRAEAGALTATDPTFELRQLVAKSVYTRVQGTVEVAQDSPGFGEQLMGVMARALAAEIDRAGIRGSGASNQPQGIIGSTGVNTVTAVGTLADYDPFVDAIALLWEDNVAESAVGPFLVSPATLKAIRKLKTGISGDKTTLTPPPGLPGFLVSQSLDDAASPATSSAIVGDYADLVLGVRREASVETLRTSTYAESLLLEYVAWARVDFLLRRPISFTTMAGINN